MKNRVKNPYFWLGLTGVIFSSVGIDFKTLTSWNLLANALLDILANPVAVVAVIAALIGVFVDPSTKGLKDTK
ncbi:phage holin [Paraclostridium sordellii]|uniref:phage holin n=1 Tax=Paraclostridium sordellii TaxID=1505 RepID=UPI0030D42B4B